MSDDRTGARQSPGLPELLESRRLLSVSPSGGVWKLRGDLARDRNDVIVIEASPGDASVLRATVNGTAVGTAAAASVQRIEVKAGRGHDRVTVNLGAAGAGVAVRVLGGPGDDRLVGSSNAEELRGDQGTDRIDGGGGNDALDGGTGNDDLLGGDGDDQMAGGTGNDVLAGGYGQDRLLGGKGRDKLDGGSDADALTADKTDRPEEVLEEDPAAAPLPRPRDDAELKQWLIEAAIKQWAWAFDQPLHGNPWGYYLATDGTVFASAVTGAPPGAMPLTFNAPTGAPGGAPGGAPAPDASPSPTAPGRGGVEGSAGTPPGSSDTNVQEAGVDEADLVETDGQYLYVLRNGELTVVNALPPGGMAVASRFAVEGQGQGVYLHGDRLTIVSQVGGFGSSFQNGWGFSGDILILRPGGGEVAPVPPKVKVTVLNVADVAAPTLVEETYFDGTYNTSRLVGDRLYLVVQNDAWMPRPQTLPAPDDGSPGSPGAAPGAAGSIVPGPPSDEVYESEAAYRARLEAMSLAELVPGYSSKAGGAETAGDLVAAPNAFVRDLGTDPNGQNLTTLSLLNVGDTAGGPTATTTVAGWSGVVYASPEAFYLTSHASLSVNSSTAPVDWNNQSPSTTRLFKFGLGPDAVPLLATGQVEGSVLNQFSMDEEGEYFRIATHSQAAVDGQFKMDSGVTVLDQVGDDLNVVGRVTGLGNGEFLRSARFIGDRGYVVTFKKTDPLYVIDLSNPANPRVAGELKIPGFSEYLHPVSEDLLIGLGRDTDDQGDFALDTGLQLSLFDVSNPADPKRVATHKLAERWERSPAEFDHHAFSYFSEQRIVALAVNRNATGQSLAVVRVDPSEGESAFELLGEQKTPSEALRAVRIGDVLYSVTANHVQALDLDDPETVLGTLVTGTV